MMFKYKYALFISVVAVIISCSNKKVSYDQKIETPLADNGLPFNLYAYKQDTSISIVTLNGTVVNIEPNTFVHANGSIVKNQIIIKVREMHSAKDIFKSGIPMSVSANRNNFLESAGMIELRAFDNDEELAIASGKSIDIALANFVPSNGYRLFHLNDNQNWQVNDTFVVQQNVRKIKGLDKIANFFKRAKSKNILNENNEFEIVANIKESPHLRTFHNQKWRIADGTNSEIVQKCMRMSWDDVIIKPVNNKINLYKLTFSRSLTLRDSGEENKILTVQASPVNTSDTAFSKQIENYDQTIVKMNNEKERLKAEADMMSRFRIRQMGVWNIDKIINKEKFVSVSLKFDFEKDLDPYVNHVKLFVLYEDDNSVISFLPQDWNNIKFSKEGRNALIAVLPGNKIAFVDAAAVSAKMKTGKTNISFETRIDYSNSFLYLK
jgi:hypothetical protein